VKAAAIRLFPTSLSDHDTFEQRLRGYEKKGERKKKGIKKFDFII